MKQSQYTKRINCFFEPAQLEAIQAKAKQSGLTVSAYIRMVAVENINADLIKDYELEYQKRFNELSAGRASARPIKDRKNASFNYLGGMLKVMSNSIDVKEYGRLNELRQKLLDI